MRNAVVTVVSGRHAHLRGQRAVLARSEPRPDLHVVVSMGDPEVVNVLDDDTGLETRLVHVAVPEGGCLPLARSRNAGVDAAIAAGAELLVVLDVDCLPAPGMLGRYAAAAETPEGAGALLAGPVTYLPPDTRSGWSVDDLAAHRAPHPARPDPPDGELLAGEHRLFWSLSFALTVKTWSRVGGFCPMYAGYGGEDTDFAMAAEQAGVPLYWVGGADAYHQHHAVSSPPVEHVADILRNGAIFNERWGFWPMEGWLEEFERLQLVVRRGAGWEPRTPLRLASIPPRHPYVAAVRPESVSAVEVDRVSGWDPDPLLAPARMRTAAGGIDVLHLHFGYDHLSVAAMDDWLAVVRERRVPLVVTVHDLRNPHHVTGDRHNAHLDLLMRHADEVLTLTDGAAAEIERRFRRRATVVAHPSLLAGTSIVDAPSTEPGLVVVHLKSLRINVIDPGRVVAAVVRGAVTAGGRVRVDAHGDVLHRAELDAVRHCAARDEIELAVHERFTDEELIDYLASAHVCVLPYRFGTHSGWLELCRDLGTRVVAPSCGYFGGHDGQWSDVAVFDCDESSGLGEQSLATAVAASLVAPPLPPADGKQRAAQLRRTRAAHADVYARVGRA